MTESPVFWLQTVGGAGITTQWYSRRGALYINVPTRVFNDRKAISAEA